jgi:hypothetical protein
MPPSDVDEVLDRPLRQELRARDLTRLAYIALDGTPRAVPIAFVWNVGRAELDVVDGVSGSATSTGAPERTGASPWSFPGGGVAPLLGVAVAVVPPRVSSTAP